MLLESGRGQRLIAELEGLLLEQALDHGLPHFFIKGPGGRTGEGEMREEIFRWQADFFRQQLAELAEDALYIARQRRTPILFQRARGHQERQQLALAQDHGRQHEGGVPIIKTFALAAISQRRIEHVPQKINIALDGLGRDLVIHGERQAIGVAPAFNLLVERQQAAELGGITLHDNSSASPNPL